MKDDSQVNRRDFLYIATGMTTAVGAAFASWPFIDQMRPDASTLAVATIDIDVSGIDQGMSITAKWRGRPIFVRNRTSAEIEASRATPIDALKDPLARNPNLDADAPATDAARSAGDGRDGWIVMIGVCTHLGCIPLGQAGTSEVGSVRATVLTTTRLAGSGRDPHPRTWPFPTLNSFRMRWFGSDEAS